MGVGTWCSLRHPVWLGFRRIGVGADINYHPVCSSRLLVAQRPHSMRPLDDDVDLNVPAMTLTEPCCGHLGFRVEGLLLLDCLPLAYAYAGPSPATP